MKKDCTTCHWHYFFATPCAKLVAFGGECSEWMLAQRCATCRHFRVKGWCVEHGDSAKASDDCSRWEARNEQNAERLCSEVRNRATVE